MAIQTTFGHDLYSQGGQEGGQFGYQGLSPEEALKQRALARKQQIANIMMLRGQEQAGQTHGQMVGRFYVPGSPLQNVAGLGQILAGVLGSRNFDQQGEKLQIDQGTKMAAAVKQYKASQSPTAVTTEQEGPGAPVPAPTANDWVNQLAPGEVADGRIAEELAKGGPGMVAEGPRPTTTTMQVDPVKARQGVIDAMTSPFAPVRHMAQFEAQQAGQAQEKKDNREFLGEQKDADRRNAIVLGTGKIDQLMTMGLINAATGKQLKEELMASMEKMNAATNASRERIADTNAEAKVDAAGQKAMQKGQLPAPALKMQQEGLDAIGLASSLNADLKALDEQVSSGKLKLGMVDNLLGTAKNYVGMSDEQSRNLVTFKATLEKQRNDSLRLNKGVQTEGDAQRAWNELIANINDPKLVSQRLKEISAINERASNLRKLEVDTVRRNYGLDPMEMSGFTDQPAAVGAGQGVAPFSDAEKEQRYQEFKKSHK